MLSKFDVNDLWLNAHCHFLFFPGSVLLLPHSFTKFNIVSSLTVFVFFWLSLLSSFQDSLAAEIINCCLLKQYDLRRKRKINFKEKTKLANTFTHIHTSRHKYWWQASCWRQTGSLRIYIFIYIYLKTTKTIVYAGQEWNWSRCELSLFDLSHFASLVSQAT